MNKSITVITQSYADVMLSVYYYYYFFPVQLQEELRKATFSLQTAEEQTGDLSLQVNILSSGKKTKNPTIEAAV